MPPNRARERLLDALSRQSPEDRETLRETLSRLAECLLESRDALRSVLEACPERILEEAWAQAEERQRGQAARRLTEQLDLTLLPAESREEPASGWIEEAGGRYRFTRAVTPEELFELTRELIGRQFRRSDYLSSPQDTIRFLMQQLHHRQQEVFAGIFLDNRHGVQAYEELFYGTIDGCSVHPREVVRRVFHHNAAAVIFAHNHPSGFAEPSRADEQITRRLKEALALIEVRVLDHIIVAGDQTVSLAERGLL